MDRLAGMPVLGRCHLVRGRGPEVTTISPVEFLGRPAVWSSGNRPWLAATPSGSITKVAA